jgi:hypothetical protein
MFAVKVSGALADCLASICGRARSRRTGTIRAVRERIKAPSG